MIKIERIYSLAREEDGFRILVDRLWPRGISKDKAKVDLWLRETAPSDGLREWFSHDPQKWEEFKKRYEKELKEKEELLLTIRQIEKEKGVITFLFSAKDEEHSNAAALKAFSERCRNVKR